MFAEYPYQVDLHSHSTFSDGKNSAEAMYQRAVALRLTSYALTDHNTLTGVLHLLQQNNLPIRRHPDEYPDLPLLVPGVEYSFRKGHFLALGIEPRRLAQQLEKWQIPAGSTRYKQPWHKIEDYLQWTVDQGGTVIAAHPGIPLGVLSVGLDKLVELWEKGLIQGAEFHNDSLERKMKNFAGRKVAKLWSLMVLKVLTEYKIPAFAFSDAHRVEHLANWCTVVPSLTAAFDLKQLADPSTLHQPSRLAKR